MKNAHLVPVYMAKSLLTMRMAPHFQVFLHDDMSCIYVEVLFFSTKGTH